MANYSFDVRHDDYPDNPFSCTATAHYTLSHRKYDFERYDEKFNSKNFSNWDEVQKWLEDDRDAHVIVTISATDHSGFYLNVGNPIDAFDSGRLGFAWFTRDELIKYFGGEDQKAIDAAIEQIKKEINEFNDYLNGEFFCAMVYKDGGLVESCGSFPSEEIAEQWAEETIEYLEEEESEQSSMIQMEFCFS